MFWSESGCFNSVTFYAHFYCIFFSLWYNDFIVITHYSAQAAFYIEEAVMSRTANKLFAIFLSMAICLSLIPSPPALAEEFSLESSSSGESSDAVSDSSASDYAAAASSSDIISFEQNSGSLPVSDGTAYDFSSAQNDVISADSSAAAEEPEADSIPVNPEVLLSEESAVSDAISEESSQLSPSAEISTAAEEPVLSTVAEELADENTVTEESAAAETVPETSVSVEEASAESAEDGTKTVSEDSLLASDSTILPSEEDSGTTSSMTSVLDETDETSSAVRIEFLLDDSEALAYLTVTSNDGLLCSPVTDSETGLPLYGTYLLPPGEYTYSFHDDSGRYADMQESFTVERVSSQSFILTLVPIRETMSFSMTYINPLYADVVTEADLPDVPVTAEESLESLQSIVEGIEYRKNSRMLRFMAFRNIVHSDVSSAADDLRDQLSAFEETATIRLSSASKPTSAQWQTLCNSIFSAAIAHTGSPTQGDYIRYEYGGYNSTGSLVSSTDGTYYYEFVYSPLYFTTAEQEETLSGVVSTILSQLDLDGKSNYEKVSSIYQYLCDNVSYGGSGNLKFTAYSALVNKTAYCQGFSTAFYRLCLSVGVNVRIITSSSMDHAWNIAQVNGSYYALDATWDCGKQPESYLYFLRGSTYWLANHMYNGVSVIGDEYSDVSFASAYAIPAADYEPTESEISGLAIDESAFPDSAFRTYLADTFDTDANGYLSEAEIAAVTEIDCSGTEESPGSISSLQGIAFFTNLEHLLCSFNTLTSLDMSGNPALKSLDCSGNSLFFMSLSSNTSLESFTCRNNCFATLDISSNTALKNLDCSGNPLTSLDLAQSSQLTSLSCGGCSLTSLSVSGCPNLTQLSCSSNKLTSLDLSSCPALTYVICEDNLLADLVLSNSANLVGLMCGSNALSSLDLSACSSLQTLVCSGNQLSELSISGCPALQLLVSSIAQPLSENGTIRYVSESGSSLVYDANTVLAHALGIFIDGTSFPDPIFRTYVANTCDTDQNGYLSASEAAAVTEINCAGTQASPGAIVSLSGIEAFTALEKLVCSYNALTALDLHANSSLKSLYCDNNQLSALDLSSNIALRDVTCSNNSLSALNLGANTSLQNLDCSCNGLTGLDLSSCTGLQNFSCYDNQLAALNLSANTSLSLIVCSSNPLNTLDLSGLSHLQYLTCTGCSLTSLVLSSCAALTSINCAANNLSLLDLDSCIYLSDLRCQNNQLAALDIGSCSSLSGLSCDHNQITTLDIRSCPSLLSLITGGTQPVNDNGTTSYTLDLSTWLVYDDSVVLNTGFGLAVDETSFPDAAFRALILANYDLDRNSYLSEDELSAVTAIRCSGTADNHGSIASLSGVEHFTALETLSCAYNQLTALNLQNNPALLELDCSCNMLSSLSLPENAVLNTLNCNGNLLTSLDASLLPSLRSLDCSNNRLTGLDLSGCTALAAVSCGSNKLSALGLGSCTGLSTLRCENNQLAALNIGGCSSLSGLSCAHNQITALDIQHCPSLLSLFTSGIQSVRENGTTSYTLDQSTWFIYDDSVVLTTGLGLAVDETSFPDAAFRAHILANYDLDRNTYLSDDELSAVKAIRCSGTADNRGTIASLSGIEHFTALELLSCAYNQLSSLDLHENPALAELDCSYNALTSLSLPVNGTLSTLKCSSNSLTSLDISLQSGLHYLDCSFNQLPSLPLSSALTELYCGSNALTELDTAGLTSLRTLSCSQNKLSSLATDSLSALQFLDLSFNPVGSVNLTSNSALESLLVNGTALSSLDLTSLTSLKKLGACVENLSVLDISSVPALVTAFRSGSGAYALSEEVSGTAYPSASADYVLFVGADTSVVSGASFTLSYDANGGADAPAAVSCEEGTVTVLSLDVPVCEGYHFLGWARSGSASAAEWASGASFTMPSADIVLYAVWEANTYSVHFNVNAPAGASASGTMEDQLFTFGKAAPLNANKYQIANYIFNGWSLEFNGTKAYSNKESVSNLSTENSGVVQLYALWTPLAHGITLYADGDALGSTAEVDMSVSPVLSLRAEISPADASSSIAWKSSPSSVATIDDSGMLTFLKPGTVTITATANDSGKTRASVVFTVYYIDSARRLTGSLSSVSSVYSAETMSGLQVGDTASIQIFGTDTSVPLSADLFDYTISTRSWDSIVSFNTAAASVTALSPKKSVSIKASLRGDPLRRSVNISVKTIPTQTSRAELVPVSYLGELVKSSSVQTFILSVNAYDALGNKIALSRGMFTYRVTDGSRIASVKENSDGTATVTVRKNVSGSFTVTATSKDAAKTVCSWSGNIIDYAPVLSTNSITMDSYAGANSGAVTLGLSFSSSNTVTGDVRFYDNRLQRDNTYAISAACTGTGNSYEVTLTPMEGLPNKRLSGQLLVPTAHGDYWADLTLTSKSTIPSVRLSASKLNTFYSDSRSQILVTCSSPIEYASLDTSQSDYLTVMDEWNGSSLSVGLRNSISGGALPSRLSATVQVQIAGFNFPISKTVNISYRASKPSYRLSPTSGTFYTGGGLSGVTLSVTPRSGSEDLRYSDGLSVTAGVGLQNAYMTGDNTFVVIPNMSAIRSSSAKVSFSVQDAGWSEPLTFAYTVRTSSSLPRLRAVSSTLTLSSGNSSASTALSSNQVNTDLNAVSGELTTTAAQAQGKLRVSCVSGVVTATILDSTVPAGTYLYSFNPHYLGQNLAAISIRVRVTA